ncbi:SapC family protein [Marinimicrobium sp. C2-29]|uniref:SapC family protein n=1 Tax=Marinimicrobium sp. C2-29 TaxID=3139825 RepID=UPI00313A047C
MSKQLLIYNNIQPVSSEAHRDWSIHIDNHAFTRELNSVPLLATEIASVARELPVIFAKTQDDGGYVPLGVMGLKKGQNLFLDDKERLTLRYVPGFIRRYPFAFANDGKSENFTLCIDDQFEGWSKDGTEGKRLFTESGEQTEELKGVMEFLKDYQYRAELTNVFCKKLAELELLEPMEANIKLKDGQEGGGFNLTGFYVVNRDKLKALKDEEVLDLFKKDGLELIFSHLQSLQNLNGLVNKYAEQTKSQAA